MEMDGITEPMETGHFRILQRAHINGLLPCPPPSSSLSLTVQESSPNRSLSHGNWACLHRLCSFARVVSRRSGRYAHRSRPRHRLRSSRSRLCVFLQLQFVCLFCFVFSGFKKEQLRVHIGSDTKLLVSGERPVIKDQWSRFRKEFQLPENCKTDQIHCKLENGLLTIMLPKSRHRGAAKGENAGKEGKEKGGVKETEGDADHGVTRKADATAGIQASRTAPAPQGEAPSDEQTKIQSTVSMDVGLHPHEGKLWVVVLLVAIAVLVWHLYQS